jgi:hypothetical protein
MKHVWVVSFPGSKAVGHGTLISKTFRCAFAYLVAGYKEYYKGQHFIFQDF